MCGSCVPLDVILCAVLCKVLTSHQLSLENEQVCSVRGEGIGPSAQFTVSPHLCLKQVTSQLITLTLDLGSASTLLCTLAWSLIGSTAGDCSQWPPSRCDCVL